MYATEITETHVVRYGVFKSETISLDDQLLVSFGTIGNWEEDSDINTYTFKEFLDLMKVLERVKTSLDDEENDPNLL